MTRLVQIQRGSERRVALVEEPRLRLLAGFASIHDLAYEAAAYGTPLTVLVGRHAGRDSVDYEPIYNGSSEWRLLAPISHTVDSARCLVSGTGLTHLGSAKNRAAMHGASDADMTDSMRMFRWGVEGGRPAPGAIGTAPEWFYKGSGGILRAPNEPLDVPPYAEDGGEEAEIAGVYLVDRDGRPLRIGMALGNEFSDHRFEKRNYLNLAGSKIRTCSIGPELVIDGGISVPALAYLMSADLGNYRTAPHHWVCQTGVPSTTLANLTNNSGEYVACQPGDRYSRIDAPMQPGAREYICVAAGEPEAGSTAGLWESLL